MPATPTPPTSPPPRRAVSRLSLGLTCLLLGVALGWGVGWGARWTGRRTSPPAAIASPAAFARAQARVAPAVVSINVATPRSAPRGQFALPPGLSLPAPVPRPDQHSLGSGVILDARGYILTNRHVVHYAQRIAVHVSGDSRTYYAQLAGADADTDLAVVKINASYPLPVAHLDTSGRLAVGDWVLAIGSPFGLDHTVTAGIVSALHRHLPDDSQYETFIQTDVPINPGNSGGPLINLQGNVVGINTAIYTSSDGYQGVAFALPSTLVSTIYPQLLHRGRVTRGSIGIYFESSIDPAVRRVYHLARGVPVSEVVANGPAARAGLRAGDVITSVNGVATDDGTALSRAIVDDPVGSSLQIGYRRAGAPSRVMVKVSSRDALFPEDVTAASTVPAPPATPDLGLKWQPAIGSGGVHGGVEITAVAPDSFAESIGMRPRDIVAEVNRQAVQGGTELHRLVSAARPGQDLALRIFRPNGDGSYGEWLLGGTVPPTTSATSATSASSATNLAGASPSHASNSAGSAGTTHAAGVR